MMKNYYLSLLLFLGCYSLTFSQTTLGNGDIVITGFNADNPDQFTFVLLTDIETGTEIKFTDNGWISTGAFRANEGIITWTATSDLSCGTEIEVAAAAPGSASTGTVVRSVGNFALATTGDQILAYQGLEATPTFIYAINFSSVGWSEATSAATSAIPAGLTDGTNAVDVGDTDNAVYNCSIITDTSAILAAVSTSANWNLSNTRYATLGGCTYTCVACSVVVTWDGTNWNWSDGTAQNTLPTLLQTVVLNGNYDTVTNGNINACSLTVNNGNTLSIGNNSFIQIQTDIIANGNINVSAEGSVVQIDDSGTVSGSGQFEVTKMTAPMRNWYEYTYWSSPTNNTDIDNGLTDGTPNRRFLFNAQNYLDATRENNNDNTQVPGQDDIDDDGNDWTVVSGGDMMLPGVGYASTHREDIFFVPPGPSGTARFAYTFTGPFNTGVINVPIYKNDTSTQDTNWNFIGNPYPSAIDIDVFFNENVNVLNASGLLDGSVYLWSQNTQPTDNTNGNEVFNFLQSDYAIINGSGETQGGEDINEDGSVDINDAPNRFIPSGQGFFVSFSDTPSSTSGNVIFNNSMRVTDSNDQFFRTNPTANKFWIDLRTDNGAFNQILVAYLDGATNDFDGTFYDAPRNLSTRANAILYSNIPNNEKKFAIQGKHSSSLDENEIVSIGFYTAIDEATIYTISIAKLEGSFLNTNDVYLKDNLLNVIHDLKDSDYNFTSEVGEFNNRFEVVFNSSVLSIDDNSIDSNHLTITELTYGDVQFKINADLIISNVEILDLLGRSVYNLNGNRATEVYNVSKLSRAAYIAKVTLSNGQIITKKAIKQK
jgi:hypothetical protein